MEIVSEPDIHSAEEAFAYIKTLQQLLIHGGISDADMERGQLRCDVNISIRKKEEDPLGERIELKNLNSISAVRRAINYEVARQSQDLDNGIGQKQSTWRWDDDMGESQLMRSKEDAHDYRYFPCPDLLPIHTAPLLEKVRPLVPELPHEISERYQNDYQLTAYDASVLTSQKELAAYFEEVAEATSAPPKKAANWVINNLLSLLKEHYVEISDAPLSAASTAKVLSLVNDGTISNSQAKELYTALWAKPDSEPAALAKEMGFEPADDSAMEGFIDEAIANNPDQVAEIKGGNEKLINFLTGQVMKASKGKANPKSVTDAIRAKLLG